MLFLRLAGTALTPQALIITYAMSDEETLFITFPFAKSLIIYLERKKKVMSDLRFYADALLICDNGFQSEVNRHSYKILRVWIIIKYVEAVNNPAAIEMCFREYS
jgi:hypothetical protein